MPDSPDARARDQVRRTTSHLAILRPLGKAAPRPSRSKKTVDETFYLGGQGAVQC
jgi:hypothetical protein